MKKIGFLLLPVLIILLGSTVVPRLLSNGMDPKILLILSAVTVIILYLFRPKKAATKSAAQVAHELTDDFSKDAFADNEALNKKYMAILNDIGNNLPKTAANKLKKLEAECTTDRQKYAVAMAAAKTCRLSQDWKNVIRECNKAIVLNPTPELAYSIGECNQRMGYLDKARDSYEFAQELDPKNPQYPSSLGTVCVGDGDYSSAIDYAQDALELDENFPQALATMAICYGMQNDTVMHKFYLEKAMANGYSQEKIESTIKALKKREK